MKFKHMKTCFEQIPQITLSQFKHCPLVIKSKSKTGVKIFFVHYFFLPGKYEYQTRIVMQLMSQLQNCDVYITCTIHWKVLGSNLSVDMSLS